MRTTLFALATLAVIIAIAAIAYYVMPWGFLQHWTAIHTGTLNEAGPYYGFWSGFGSDLGEITIIGACIGLYKKHNCHEHRCWRMAKFDVEGTPYRVCRKHHPTIPDKAYKGEITEAHAIAQEAARQ